MIADTTFIIDLLKNNGAAVEKLEEIERNNTLLRTTSISVFELFEGIVRSNKPKIEQQKVERHLEVIETIPLEMIGASLGGRAQGALFNKGNPIGSEDAMIAGIALAKNETILTRNAKDFKKIDGLKIETY